MATRLDLRTRARGRADQDGADFPTDAHYNSFIDEAAKETFADLVMSGWPIDSSTSTIVTNGVTRTYAFGGTDTVFSATLVYTLLGGSQLELKRVNPGHIASLRSTAAQGGVSQFYEVRTSVAGPVIEFFGRAAGTYFVDYIVDFPGFANDASVWLGPPRSDELIVLLAASKGCKKESRVQDAKSLSAEYDELLQKVQRLASWFDQRNAAEMRDASPTTDPFCLRSEFFAGPGGMF